MIGGPTLRRTVKGELLIDCEEDRTLRAVVVEMLLEAGHHRRTIA
jgi:hypothetical protein